MHGMRRHRYAMRGRETSTRFPARPAPVMPYGGPEAMFGEFGFSLKPPAKVRAAAKKVGKAVGKVVDSKIARAVVGTALAATGVGVPAAAGIMAAQRATGKALQGARIKTIAKATATGAATGAAAGIAGKVLPKIPGLKRPVAALRSRVGRGPAAMPTATPTSVPGAAELDRIVATTGMPVPHTIANEVKDAARDSVLRKSAEVVRVGATEAVALEQQAATAKAQESAATTPAEKKSFRDKASALLKKAASVSQKARAVSSAMRSVEPSAAMPSGGGGYGPAEGPTSTSAIPDAGSVGGISPMMLAALGIGALFVLSRK